MSHIISFSIEGLAGRSTTFSKKLDRHTNVFFGLNGCGKTSLLKILHSAMTNDASSLFLVPCTSASVTIHSLAYDANFERTIEKKASQGGNIRIEEANEVIINQSRILLSSDEEKESLQWKTFPIIENASISRWFHQYLPTSRLILGQQDLPFFRGVKQNEIHNISEEEIDNFFADSIKKLWSEYTSNLNHNIRIAQEAGMVSILREVLTPPKANKNHSKTEHETHQAYLRMKKFVSRKNSDDLISSEETFKKRYNEDIVLQRVVQDINSTELQIEEASAPRNRLEDLVKNLFSRNKETTFSDRSIDIKTTSGINIGISSLSSGEKHVLRLLVETLLAGESSIIIDEPELSLHIDWQKGLIKMMQTVSPKAQLILATHSPEVMAEISDKYITRM